MWELGYNLIMLAKVVILFGILFIFIPAVVIKFDPDHNSLLDKIFISLTHSVLLTIVITHLLAIIKIYEIFSLFFLYALSYVIIVWVRGRSPGAFVDALGMRFIVKMLDLSEGQIGLAGEMRQKAKIMYSKVKKQVVSSIKFSFVNPFRGILLIAILFWAAWIRFEHSIDYAYFSTSDSYVHLAWAKYMGFNQLYHDGIYPYGYQGIISALSKLFFLDPYYIIRFIGPVAGVLIVISIYYFIVKIFNNPQAALLAAFFYGIITDIQFPSQVWRQTAALSMEFGDIFFLPGLYFFITFFKNNDIKYLILAAECLALSILIHPYVTVFLGLGYLFIGLGNAIKLFHGKTFYQVLITMITGTFLGFFPLLIGFLSGKGFHSTTVGYITENVDTATEFNLSSLLKGFSEANPYLNLFLISLVIIFLVAVVGLFVNKKQQSKTILILICFSLVLYFIFKAPDLGLPTIMDSYRSGIFLAILVAVMIGLSISILDFFVFNKKMASIIKSIACMVALIMIVNFQTPFVFAADKLEYDAAAKNYLEIKKNYPVLNWTIISPTEQYQECLGYGWHYQIWEFVEKISDAEETEMVFPTDYVFLFVEKVPLGSDTAVTTEDRDKTIVSQNTGDTTEYYYRDVENRRVLEAKAYYWAEEFMKRRSELKVFYEDDQFKIYFIEQDGQNPINILN